MRHLRRLTALIAMRCRASALRMMSAALVGIIGLFCHDAKAQNSRADASPDITAQPEPLSVRLHSGSNTPLSVVTCPPTLGIPCVLTLRNGGILVGRVGRLRVGEPVVVRLSEDDWRMFSWSDIATALPAEDAERAKSSKDRSPLPNSASLQPQNSQIPPAAAAGSHSSATPRTVYGCSTADSIEGEVRVRVDEDTMEVVSKRIGAAPQCAAMRLPKPGRIAIVRDGVAYVSLSPTGLAIVDVADPANPRYDRTEEIETAIGSMRDVNGTLWMADANNAIVKRALRNLQPSTKEQASSYSAVSEVSTATIRRESNLPVPHLTGTNETTPDSRLAGRSVLLRDGSTVQGRLVELVPNRRITMLVADGTSTTIPLTAVGAIKAIAYSPPSPVRALPTCPPVGKPASMFQTRFQAREVDPPKTCREDEAVYIDGQKFVDARHDANGSLYVVKETSRIALLITGSSLLGGGYLISLGILGGIGTSPSSLAAAGFDASTTWMAVPIIGPYIFAAKETPHQLQQPETVTETCSNTKDVFLCIPGTSHPRSLGQFQLALLTTPATLQLVGLAILGLGVATEKPKRTIIYPAPIPGGGGISLFGRF